MAPKILLYTDDAKLAESVLAFLAEDGYSAKLISQEDELLKTVCTEGDYLLLAEAQVLGGEGNPLFSHLRRQSPDLRIYLIAEFEQLEKLKGTIDGCSGIIPKPIQKADLILHMDAAFEPVEKISVDESNYARVGIEEFAYYKNLPCSVYIRLKNHTFVKVANRGQGINLDLIDKFNTTGLHEFWLESPDFQKYVDASHTAAMDAKASKDIDSSRRNRLINHACEVAVENLRLAGVTPENVKAAQEVLMSAISSITTAKDALALLETIEGGKDRLYTHATTCGIFCGLIARVMGWVSEKNILALTLGGYLHDIGMHELPFDLQCVDPEEMTLEQRSRYEQHPRSGSSKLAQISCIPREVVVITMQHHENPSGTGFPRQLKSDQIFPLTKIVSLVDGFCSNLLKSPHNQRQKMAVEILETLVAENISHFDENAVLALKLALTTADPAEAAKNFHWMVSHKNKK